MTGTPGPGAQPFGRQYTLPGFRASTQVTDALGVLGEEGADRCHLGLDLRRHVAGGLLWVEPVVAEGGAPAGVGDDDEPVLLVDPYREPGGARAERGGLDAHQPQRGLPLVGRDAIPDDDVARRGASIVDERERGQRPGQLAPARDLANHGAVGPADELDCAGLPYEGGHLLADRHLEAIRQERLDARRWPRPGSPRAAPRGRPGRWRAGSCRAAGRVPRPAAATASRRRHWS